MIDAIVIVITMTIWGVCFGYMGVQIYRGLKCIRQNVKRTSDLNKIQQQLKQVNNDPSLTISTGYHFMIDDIDIVDYIVMASNHPSESSIEIKKRILKAKVKKGGRRLCKWITFIERELRDMRK